MFNNKASLHQTAYYVRQQYWVKFDLILIVVFFQFICDLSLGLKIYLWCSFYCYSLHRNFEQIQIKSSTLSHTSGCKSPKIQHLFAEPLEGAAQVKTAALVSWLTLPHFRQWRQRERNTSPEARGQWVHPHCWGTFLSVTVREEIQGIQVPRTGANIKVRWFCTHGRSLMLHKGNSVIAQMKTGWLQRLNRFDKLLVWSLVTGVRGNEIQITQPLPFKVTKSLKFITEKWVEEEIFPMDRAEMYIQALENKARKRKFQKVQYAFVYKAACTNSTTLRFHQIPHDITIPWHPIFVTATISHEGAEFKWQLHDMYANAKLVSQESKQHELMAFTQWRRLSL